MIKICNTIEMLNKVESYIDQDFHKCLYLYMDLKKYGIENENVKTYIQYNDNNEIVSVFLKYYTGLHVYSKNYNFDVVELSNYILDLKPTMICGEKRCLNLIENEFLKNNFLKEEGWVRKLSKNIEGNFENVQTAQKEDFYSIAKLIYEDEDLGSSYKLDELESQLYERNKDGYVRNYIIKDNGKVVAHAGTGAEVDNVSMLGYVITDANSRGKGLATILCSKVCKDLQNEGKNVFLINYSNESTRLYDKIGFEVCCEWEKLFLNLK